MPLAELGVAVEVEVEVPGAADGNTVPRLRFKPLEESLSKPPAKFLAHAPKPATLAVGGAAA